jgi:hypothetical protein
MVSHVTYHVVINLFRYSNKVALRVQESYYDVTHMFINHIELYPESLNDRLFVHDGASFLPNPNIVLFLYLHHVRLGAIKQ